MSSRNKSKAAAGTVLAVCIAGLVVMGIWQLVSLLPTDWLAWALVVAGVVLFCLAVRVILGRPGVYIDHYIVTPDPFRQGQTARTRGLAYDHNPYAPHSQDGRAWRCGWRCGAVETGGAE